MEKFKYEKYDYTKIGIGVFKKFKTSWSPELAQDVSAFHNIDAEAELTVILPQQIAEEINRVLSTTL